MPHTPEELLNVPALESALASGWDINTRFERGMTLAMLAIRQRRYYVLEVLVQQGADLSVRDHYQKSVVEHCVDADEPNLFKLLKRSKRSFGLNPASPLPHPLQYALDTDSSKMIRELVKLNDVIVHLASASPKTLERAKHYTKDTRVATRIERAIAAAKKAATPASLQPSRVTAKRRALTQRREAVFTAVLRNTPAQRYEYDQELLAAVAQHEKARELNHLERDIDFDSGRLCDAENEINHAGSATQHVMLNMRITGLRRKLEGMEAQVDKLRGVSRPSSRASSN